MYYKQNVPEYTIFLFFYIDDIYIQFWQNSTPLRPHKNICTSNYHCWSHNYYLTNIIKKARLFWTFSGRTGRYLCTNIYVWAKYNKNVSECSVKNEFTSCLRWTRAKRLLSNLFTNMLFNISCTMYPPNWSIINYYITFQTMKKRVDKSVGFNALYFFLLAKSGCKMFPIINISEKPLKTVVWAGNRSSSWCKTTHETPGITYQLCGILLLILLVSITI